MFMRKLFLLVFFFLCRELDELILTGEILGIEIMHLNEIKVLMKY